MPVITHFLACLVRFAGVLWALACSSSPTASYILSDRIARLSRLDKSPVLLHVDVLLACESVYRSFCTGMLSCGHIFRRCPFCSVKLACGNAFIHCPFAACKGGMHVNANCSQPSMQCHVHIPQSSHMVDFCRMYVLFQECLYRPCTCTLDHRGFPCQHAEICLTCPTNICYGAM